MDWWRRMNDLSLDPRKKGLNSMIVLGAWILWKHRNRFVFDGDAPSMAAALRQAHEERRTWEMAGARGISVLTTQIA
jgi:hypothetical protein